VPTSTELAQARRIALGRRLGDLRRARGLTQEALADKAGIHRTFLARVENGRTSIAVDRLLALADALGVRIHDVLPQDEEEVDRPHRCSSGGGQRPLDADQGS
jgi:transcriptional regulator with XRE-family HTH domain